MAKEKRAFFSQKTEMKIIVKSMPGIEDAKRGNTSSSKGKCFYKTHLVI